MNPNNPDLLITHDEIPREVLEAANLITNWTTRNGYKDWMLMGIADRGLVSKLRAALRIFTQ